MKSTLRLTQLMGAILLLIAIPISIVLLNTPSSAQLSAGEEAKSDVSPESAPRFDAASVPEINASHYAHASSNHP